MKVIKMMDKNQVLISSDHLPTQSIQVKNIQHSTITIMLKETQPLFSYMKETKLIPNFTSAKLLMKSKPKDSKLRH